MHFFFFPGTDQGNVLFLNATTFVRSAYTIMWNKACAGDYKAKPGSVLFMEPHPTDTSKLLLGYQSGLLVLWNMQVFLCGVSLLFYFLGNKERGLFNPIYMY